ncbi:Coiled-coil domain-containing protein 25 [Psilocybe cubensis]|uniref:Coiled-coil domain-containing protein 25 n=1 Tax=Psilocybe cubensis TaxID=181762 RepID=A0ACB8GZ35_PSICU|nr:Coiled-coil domain-containing protein 25 [Psilocybe cubensis]KAH9480692.1 Coiled-coil domain-containing protein 25 [Psilocybe cubensis]
MVLFFKSTAVNPPALIYMGKDKVENEELIKYAWPQDIWFHVDKLSSAHVYIRMSEGMTWDTIPQDLLTDCAQLVKANSIEVHVATRENAIVNRLNKTKTERQVDHEQERIDRIKKENAIKRAAAAEKKKQDAELAKAREAEKQARSYDSLFNVEEDEYETGPRKTGRELEEDFM